MKSAGNSRKRESVINDLTVIRDAKSDHHWIHLTKKRRCNRCKTNKTRLPKRKREPLAEVDDNGRKRRKRGAQTQWGCGAVGCKDKAACKISECWTYMHTGVNIDDDMDAVWNQNR